MHRLSLLLASGCYIGLIPGAPGTYASIATALAFYCVFLASRSIRPELHLSTVCLVSIIGILSAARVSRDSGNEDPQVVVIDEIAGQLLAFLLIPVNLLNLCLGTALFRLFDIWKPFPIRKLEGLKDGVGIMADDLLAGVYANLLLHLANWAVRQLK